jgi:hypothetical protein
MVQQVKDQTKMKEKFSGIKFPEDGNCIFCRNVEQLPIFNAAHTRKPRFYILLNSLIRKDKAKWISVLREWVS